MSKPQLFRAFGWLSIIASVAFLVAALTGLLGGFQLGMGGSLIILMLIATSAAIIVAAGLIERQHPSAEKIFPSCLVAYGLVLVIFNYWYQQSS